MKATNRAWYKKLGWAGVALCGLCCALPIIGTAAGIASLTAIAVYLEKTGILILGLSVFFFWYALHSKKKKVKDCSNSCDTACDCATKDTGSSPV